MVFIGLCPPMNILSLGHKKGIIMKKVAITIIAITTVLYAGWKFSPPEARLLYLARVAYKATPVEGGTLYVGDPTPTKALGTVVPIVYVGKEPPPEGVLRIIRSTSHYGVLYVAGHWLPRETKYFPREPAEAPDENLSL